jgi:Acetyltransferase (GNAT) domain
LREQEWSVPSCGTRVRVVTPAPRDEWLSLIRSSPDALLTQTPAWLDCLCEVGGYEDGSRLYETVDGRTFVLPLARRRFPPNRLASLASMPASWGMGGIVTAGGVKQEDVAAVFADLTGRPALTTSIRPNPLCAPAWAAARPPAVACIPRRAHVLDLSGGFSHVSSKRFTSTARAGIRKAERLGVVVERDTSAKLVPVFYELFRRSLDRWAQRQHEPRWLAQWRGRRRDPIRKFQAMTQKLGNGFRLWVASVEGKPAAAIMVLQGPNAHYTRGAMDHDLAGPAHANELLHRMAIEEACQEGCRHYHMGESGSSEGLARFKERFGAEPHDYSEFHLERLPIRKATVPLRQLVKRTIGFRD